jgi:predicted RNA-binding Zn-ribbon protein involved in translation (DUF1610 family)
MPRGDGTGPAGGGGPGTGRGGGRGMGGGGRGQGRGGGAYGPSGYCLCVACKTRVPHQAGITCTDLKCPNCGKTMVREELYNDRKQS